MKTDFLKTKTDITAWLDKYKVENYTLVEDPDYGYAVNVEGSVDLWRKNLKFVPVKFNSVSKTFDCCDNELTSLEFCPTVVNGDFNCYENQLTSLKFCPERVGGSFDCSDNQIALLEFCPQSMDGNFYCYNNKALGSSQYIESFADILSIHQEIVRIKKEKECIEEQLKVPSSDNILSKSVIKV